MPKPISPVFPLRLRSFEMTAFFLRRDLPRKFLRLARRYGDVVHLKIGREEVFLLSHPDLVRQVLTGRANQWSKARGVEKTKKLLGNGILGSEGEFHRGQRRLMQPLFSAARLPIYAQTIVDCALQTRDSWRDGQTVDMNREMSDLALNIIARSIFGVGVEGQTQRVSHALDEAMQLFNASMTPLGDWLERVPFVARRFETAKNSLDELIFGFIEAKRQNGTNGDDLLSVLLRAQNENGDALSDQQLRDEAITLFLAGHETTANALSFAWYFLSKSHQTRQKLDEELKNVLGNRLPNFDDLEHLQWTRAILSETMRLLPPAWIVGRRALQNIELELDGAQFTVPEGATTLLSSFIVHRDKRFWNEPNRFDPSRWHEEDFAPTRWSYFPFGGGHRACIAENFAWMEAMLSLATLAQKFHTQMAPQNRLKLEASVTLRPRGELKMRVQIRK